MNSLFRNILKTSRFPFRFPSETSYSSVVGVAEAQVAEEPDKLYKTIEIEMRANERSAMASYATFATTAAQHLGITQGRCYAIPMANYERDKLCLLRSGFVNKDIRVQYEVRTYFRILTFHNLTGSTADTFLEYIERNLPEGVALKISKTELRKLPEEVTRPFVPQELTESAATISEGE